LTGVVSQDVRNAPCVSRRLDRRPLMKDYASLITGPMRVLGSSAELMPAVVRYVETKTLLGGVTTTQGIALFSNNGARRYYRGLVRNVESTAGPDLPDALTRIADVDASDGASFLARLQKASCLLLHLSEGTNPAAHKHFEPSISPGATTRSVSRRWPRSPCRASCSAAS
jgi:hypothetical protein